ncbi:MAG: metal-dependent hydrolase [Deltaproteobacteria bacterium]|nr:metal-dependent hydrolase [Deltaproteobacteria bacterium]
MDVSTHETQGARPIKPRSPGVTFDAAMPRYWFGGLKHASLLANGVNLLFPKGERFFVRSVMHYLPQLDDPTLRAQVKGFAGQEHRHARAHEDYSKVMEAQGYEVEAFLKVFERIAFDGIERVSPAALRLAVTAATEHFTAIMAEDALSRGYLAAMDSEVGRLLMWHAAEEIEHKAVAFDVLAKVAPGYPLRMAGLALASTLLGGFWLAAVITLARQDAKLPPEPHREPTEEEKKNSPLDIFARGIREYMRPSFHPNDRDNLPLAVEALRSLGLEPA